MYVKIRSWHIVATPTRMLDTYRTLCGRMVTTDDIRFSSAERSCESCLRIDERKGSL